MTYGTKTLIMLNGLNPLNLLHDHCDWIIITSNGLSSKDWKRGYVRHDRRANLCGTCSPSESIDPTFSSLGWVVFHDWWHWPTSQVTNPSILYYWRIDTEIVTTIAHLIWNSDMVSTVFFSVTWEEATELIRITRFGEKGLPDCTDFYSTRRKGSACSIYGGLLFVSYP